MSLIIKISHREITRGCANHLVYLRGERYYRRGAVVSLQHAEKPGHVTAQVQGTKKYDVKIIKQERSLRYYCSCPAHAAYEGYCKHVVAVMLALYEKGAAAPENEHRSLTDELLHYYAGLPAGETGGKEVVLELHLRIDDRSFYQSRLAYRATMKIGESGARKYVVRDFNSVVDAVARRQPLHFGKQFTYEPSQHYFAPSSRGLLDFLIQIYEIEAHPDYYYSPELLKGKEIELSAELFRRLLASLKELPFCLQLGSRIYPEVRVSEAALPLSFSISEGGEGLALAPAGEKKLELLTDEGDIVLYGGQIYCLADTAQASLAPLLQALGEEGGTTLLFSGSQEQRFFADLYPVIEKAAAVEMAPALQKRLYRPPLEARVYLDYEESAVSARLEFVYGKRTIHLFNPAADQESEEEQDNLILLRDSAAEQRVMRFFEDAEFTVRGNAMHLEEEERIWIFISELLPALQQHAAVFYSKNFKQAHRKAPSFTGRAGIDWQLDLLELDLELEGVAPEELSEVWESLRIKRRYHRLRDGSILPLEGEGIRQFSLLAEALELQPPDLQESTVRLPKYQALHFDELIRQFKTGPVKESAELTALVQQIRRPADGRYPLPPSLEGVLRGYQVTGFKWLKSLARFGFGGILADDMGLGKTVQAIAFILSEKEKGGALPALVITPASLIYNWEAEIEKFAPQLKTLVIAGTKQERRQLLAGIGSADVVITSYPLLRRDVTAYAALDFSSCFLDEAQFIKNPRSLTAQCARRIKSPHRFALTGTPIENSLMELWSIFQFVMPGYLQSQKRFLQKYGAAPGSGKKMESLPLAAKVRPFILRRLKSEVLTELPPKIEHRYLSDLTTDQKKIYQAYLERLRSETRQSLQEHSFNRSRIQILAGLTRLRQICCHPSLFIENYHGESAKLLQLEELLHEAVDGGHRILLFSQFTGMLHLIKALLERKGYRYFYLDGSTRASARLEMVDRFNSGEREIFLISLKAGGTGLNLTGADMVIQYDLWWNPAVEEQAADRAHRIGQKKVVQVFRLLARGTIEEKIFELQQKKKELINRVIQPGETFLSAMSEADIREILEL